MRKYIYFIITMILLSFLFNGCQLIDNSLELTELNYTEIKDKLIRFHVIANSDTEEDQALKLKVRDKVIDALSDKMKDAKTVEEAKRILESNIDFVNDIAKEVITENNYSYNVNTMLSHENFPDKVYGDYIFPQGNYEAFRVIIGDGRGHNWWCVMFPPICFVDETKSEVDSSELKENIENIEVKKTNKKDKEKKENEDEELSNDSNNEVEFEFKIVEVIRGLFN